MFLFLLFCLFCFLRNSLFCFALLLSSVSSKINSRTIPGLHIRITKWTDKDFKIK